MQKNGICAFVCLVILGVPTLTAGTVTVEATASYNVLLSGGGSWSFSYLSGDPGLILQSLTIDLGPTGGLAFDTAPGGFGSQGSQNIGNFNGSDVTTGLTGYTPAGGAALDGGTTVTFTFNDFRPGETFQFDADVDHPNPVLTNCTGKSGFALLTCNLQNTVALTSAQTVTANQMANANVTFVFGGPGFVTGSSTGTFGPVTLRDILSEGPGNHIDISSPAVAAPEPASLSMMGGGLLLAAGLMRRKRSR
jgi:hypothetical protein